MPRGCPGAFSQRALNLHCHVSPGISSSLPSVPLPLLAASSLPPRQAPMLPKHLLDQALSPFAAGLGPEARPRSHPVPVLGHWCMPRESGVLRVLLVPVLPSRFLPCPRFSTVEPSGLLLYNGRLNERHDFLAVEIIQGQVQLKYSTGKLGPACHRICAVGATRRPALSRERGCWPGWSLC